MVDASSITTDEALIDSAQWRTIRQVMGERYVTAASLFLEYAIFGIESMKRAVEGKRLPEIYVPLAARLKDSAQAIGASRLGSIAARIERIAEQAVARDDSTVDVGAFVTELERCFLQTRHIFLSVQTLLPYETCYVPSHSTI